MSKITVTAIITFEAELDPDSDLIPVDQANDAAVMALPHGFDLEEIIEWEPKP